MNLFDDDLLPKLTVTASWIAFGYGGASATIKSFGAPKGGSNNQQGSASNGMWCVVAVFLTCSICDVSGV